MLCDSGSRYVSKLYNPGFLRSKGLPVPHWLEREPTSRPLHALLPEVLLPKVS